MHISCDTISVVILRTYIFVRVRGVGNKVLEARHCLSSLIVGRIRRFGRTGTIGVGRRVGIGGRSRAGVRNRVGVRSRLDVRSRVDVMTREAGSSSVGGGTRVGGRSSVGGRRSVLEGIDEEALSVSYRRTIDAVIGRRAGLIINRIRRAPDNCVTTLLTAAPYLAASAGFCRSKTRWEKKQRWHEPRRRNGHRGASCKLPEDQSGNARQHRTTA
jgi:hypothetical protein